MKPEVDEALFFGPTNELDSDPSLEEEEETCPDCGELYMNCECCDILDEDFEDFAGDVYDSFHSTDLEEEIDEEGNCSYDDLR